MKMDIHFEIFLGIIFQAHFHLAVLNSFFLIAITWLLDDGKGKLNGKIWEKSMNNYISNINSKQCCT